MRVILYLGAVFGDAVPGFGDLQLLQQKLVLRGEAWVRARKGVGAGNPHGGVLLP